MDSLEITRIAPEYCPEGDFFSRITKRGRYVGNDTESQSGFLRRLDAVEHCHRLGIHRRELNPENILDSNKGGRVLLANFGFTYHTSRVRGSPVLINILFEHSNGPKVKVLPPYFGFHGTFPIASESTKGTSGLRKACCV